MGKIFKIMTVIILAIIYTIICIDIGYFISHNKNDTKDYIQIDTIYNKVILDSIKYNIIKKDSIIIHYKHEMTNEIQESINDNDSNAVNRFKELVDGI